MNWTLWAFTPLRDDIYYHSATVSDDNVQDAFKECRKYAIDHFSTEDVICMGWNWNNEWLGTAWWTPPPPQVM